MAGEHKLAGQLWVAALLGLHCVSRAAWVFGIRICAQPLPAGVDALQKFGFVGTCSRRSSAHAFGISHLMVRKIQRPFFKKPLLLHLIQVRVGKHGFGVWIVG
jgi:hypothetical protein